MALIVRIECFDDYDRPVDIYEIDVTQISEIIASGELNHIISSTVFAGGKIVVSSRIYH